MAPSVGSSAGIIAPGFFQLESGVEYSRRSRAANLPELRIGTEMLLPTGLIEGLEARLLVGLDPGPERFIRAVARQHVDLAVERRVARRGTGVTRGGPTF